MIQRLGAVGLELVASVRRDPLLVLPLSVISALLIMALFASYIAPHSYERGDLLARLQPPSREHPFGTDHLGRDVLSRIVYGSRVTLMVILTVMTFSIVLGTAIGLAAGYVGGTLDVVLSRVVDVVMSIPAVLIALAVVAVLGQGLDRVVVAIVLAELPLYVRLVRSLVIVEKEKLYVEASKALGAEGLRIVRVHILPNIAGPIVVQATFTAATAVLFEAALSFLGLGAEPPTPSWGLMLYESKQYFRIAPHVAVFPGLAIFLTVFSINALGEKLRDRLDPRARALLK
ncbi:MAG: ABC transporter permease [Acidilobaceae archaeon]|nr:ABC transporter permease [Acidilobaceae archaeon]